jgi:hypothetical protein
MMHISTKRTMQRTFKNARIARMRLHSLIINFWCFMTFEFRTSVMPHVVESDIVRHHEKTSSEETVIGYTDEV